MPRHTANNPTERIGRLLEEFSLLEEYAQTIADLLPFELISQAPPFPSLVAFAVEKALRERYLKSNLSSRASAKRRRLRLEASIRSALGED